MYFLDKIMRYCLFSMFGVLIFSYYLVVQLMIITVQEAITLLLLQCYQIGFGL